MDFEVLAVVVGVVLGWLFLTPRPPHYCAALSRTAKSLPSREGEKGVIPWPEALRLLGRAGLWRPGRPERLNLAPPLRGRAGKGVPAGEGEKGVISWPSAHLGGGGMVDGFRNHCYHPRICRRRLITCLAALPAL
jgi:hypothetical protein